MNQANIEKFSCKICLEIAQEPVITSCGHLYCWACIYEWKTKKEGSLTCPFCQNPIDIQKITPIYTSEEKKDNNPYDIPKRPQPKRNSPPPVNEEANRGNNFNFNIFGFPFLFGGFGLSFGGNNPQNIHRNHNIRPNTMMSSSFYMIFIMIALNIFLNFGPLFLGGGSYDEYEDEIIHNHRKKSTVEKKNTKSFNSYNKTNQSENEYVWFLGTMVFFFGIALLWKFLKKRN